MMIKILMVSCKLATELSERQASGERLPLLDKLRMAYHFKLCATCKRFANHSKAIDAAMRNRLSNDESAADGPVLPAPAKRRILQLLAGAKK